MPSFPNFHNNINLQRWSSCFLWFVGDIIMDSWIFKIYLMFQLIIVTVLFEAQSYPFLVSGSPFCVGSCFLLVQLQESLIASFLFCKKQWPGPELIQFPKEPWFLLVRTGILKTTVWALLDIYRYWLAIASRPFQWTKLGKI